MNLREASMKESKSKDEKEEESEKSAKSVVSHVTYMPDVLSVTDLSSLSRSLEEFEREYAEMCKSPMMPCCQNGTLQDSSAALAIKASCARVSSGGATGSSSGGSLRSRKNSGPPQNDDKTDVICARSVKGTGQSRSADNSPKIPRRNVMHDERNRQKNNKVKAADDADISQRIEDLTRTVRELQNSLSSLDSAGLSDEDIGRQDRNTWTETSGKSLKEETNRSRGHVGREDRGDLDNSQGQQSPETLSPEERAAMLDTLVGGFSSSGEGEESDEYVYLTPEGAPADGHVIDRLRVMPDGKQKVRVTPTGRKAVDVDTFIRYSEPEHRAISTFSFLEDMASSTSQSQSEDEPDGVRKKNACLRNGKIARQATPTAKGKLSHRSDADGAANSANSESSCKGKGSQVASRPVKAAVDGKLKPRPMNRTVLALREESKKDSNRLSNVSFDTATFGADGICLSDSCCEEFSSGGSDSDSAKA